MSDDNTNDGTTIKRSHEREAARVNLRKMLESKSRGDQITAAEVAAATGFDDWQSFGSTIRSWALAAGLALIAIKNEGWQIATPDAQVTSASKDRQSAVKKIKRSVTKLATTPLEALSEPAYRRYERELIATSRAHAIVSEDDKAIRKEFKLGSQRVPLRLVEKAE